MPSGVTLEIHQTKTFSNFILRQADKNGDGRLSLDEIIAIFKVT